VSEVFCFFLVSVLSQSQMIQKSHYDLLDIAIAEILDKVRSELLEVQGDATIDLMIHV
jgi:hypothetical protein